MKELFILCFANNQQATLGLPFSFYNDASHKGSLPDLGQQTVLRRLRCARDPAVRRWRRVDARSAR